ncbi:DUF982 domain-containing protein [Neomesorhizobium albiziae]|uniref:DUF982 domain-containing protein n=1 Tax=Neomesorhizobium albiziae TaxID=335020 RepID=UPI00122C4E3D|nr:DUF982 domain-containing protein [Mesorhizobium albiziae]
MQDATFQQPVHIAFGRPAPVLSITTTQEAARHLLGSQWPEGPMREIAALALVGVSSGDVTTDEAREAFVDAAIEAGVLIAANSTI